MSWTSCHDHEVDYRIEDGCPVCELCAERDALKTRIAELEAKLLLCREVQEACFADDAEGPHYLGHDLYSRFISADLT